MACSSLSFKYVVDEWRWTTVFLEMFLIRAYNGVIRHELNGAGVADTVQLDEISNGYVWT